MKEIKVFVAEVTKELDSLGGHLECTKCHKTKQLSKNKISYYLSNGWPECCGQTMQWYTQKELDKESK